jgi:hypothetical protein
MNRSIFHARPYDVAVAWRQSPTHRKRAPAIATLLGIFLAATPASAIGPETPVDFVDAYLASGYLVMVLEPRLVTDVELVRAMHRDGESVSREQVKWRELPMLEYTAPITGPEHFQYRDPHERDAKPSPQAAPPLAPLESAKPNPKLQLADPGAPLDLTDGPPQRVGVVIPLDLERHSKLADGAYAEQYLARARLAGESEKTKPLAMMRWVHFVVRSGQVRVVSSAEYSRLVDPPDAALDGAGAKIEVNTGRDVKADVPLERTKKTNAVPLGPLGGVAPEREAAKAKPSTEESQER